MTSIFKPNFLEQILGKNYKWWFLLKYQVKKNTTYRWSTILWMIGRLTVLFTAIFVWWINIQAGSNLYNFKDIFTYYIFGNLIAVGNGVQWNISNHIKSGSLSNLLLLPGPIMPKIILADFGWWLFPIFVEIMLMVLAIILGWQFVILPSAVNFVLYLFCGLIGYIISIFFAYILGSIAFFMTDTRGILDLQSQANYFLSGKAVPLNVIIFLQPISLLPFAFTFYHPMQIYLGKYNFEQTIYVFLGGIAWCIFLFLLSSFVFKMGLKRNESVGL